MAVGMAEELPVDLLNLKPYFTTSCNVIVMYKENAVGLVEMQKVNLKP